MKDKNVFDATPSALGYIYQVRYALLLALKKIQEVDDPDDCYISIETVDDISFEENGSPVDLLQTKYHGKSGNITDRSTDLWKTIRVWSDFFLKQAEKSKNTVFTLLTTELAAKDSIAHFLNVEKTKRNTHEALKLMLEISKEKTNVANDPGYQSFNNLSADQQELLLESIFFFTKAPEINEVYDQIKKMVRMTVSNTQIDAFTTRLEGFWFKRVIDVMSSNESNDICLAEIVEFLEELRDQFKPDNLPSDFDDVNFDIIDLDDDRRDFVQQLRLIKSNDRLLRIAIVNYHRAFEQRSRWSREGLVYPGEMKKYIDKLKNEWEHQCSIVELMHDVSQPDANVMFGRKLYSICQNEKAIPIRNGFKSENIARGTYHYLSDLRYIGWHPEYESLLSASNESEAA